MAKKSTTPKEPAKFITCLMDSYGRMDRDDQTATEDAAVQKIAASLRRDPQYYRVGAVYKLVTVLKLKETPIEIIEVREK